jgi:hypothetical protein
MKAGIADRIMGFEDVLARIDEAQASKVRGPYKKRGCMSRRRWGFAVIVALGVLAVAIPLFLSGNVPGWPHPRVRPHRVCMDCGVAGRISN